MTTTKLAAGMAQASMLTGSPITASDVEDLNRAVRDELARMLGQAMHRGWLEAVAVAGEMGLDKPGDRFRVGVYTVHVGCDHSVQPWCCTCPDSQKRGDFRPCGHWLAKLAVEIRTTMNQIKDAGVAPAAKEQS